MIVDGISVPMLVGAAVIDSINPCAFGVLIFLLAYLMKAFKSSRRMVIHGLVYTFAVFLTYFVAGLILLPVISSLGKVSVASYVVIACLIILAGLVEIKDFFWYGRGFSLSIFPSSARRIKLYVAQVSEHVSTAFFLGVFVALVELPCTGAVYLAVLALISMAGVSVNHVALLVLYNLIFVLPLIVIIYLIAKGMAVKKFEVWRDQHKGLMRLATGLLLIVLGVWMMVYVFVRG